MPLQEILSKSAYTFTATGEVIVVRSLDVSAYRSIVVFVRCHATSLGTGSSLAVQLFAFSPSEEDPGTDFVGTSALAEASLDNAAAVGELVHDYVAPPSKVSHVQIRVKGTKGAGACAATISAGLWLNECEATEPNP